MALIPSLLVSAYSFVGGAAAAQDGSPAAHFRIAEPATVGGARAELIYQAIRSTMRAHYAQSRDPVTVAYQQWRRFNSVPYRSSHHGERFVNNYANEAALHYGRFEKAGEMPVGAVIAKDSFSVTAAGVVRTAPLALMQKKPEGFDPGAGNWLFLTIQPDGTLAGASWSQNTKSVATCVQCHSRAPPGQDFLFLLPQKYRKRADAGK